MPHLYQAVFRIVGIGVGFRHAALPASRVRVGYGLRLSCESIAGGGHLVSAQQVALNGLGHPPFEVIVISRVQLGRGAGHGDFAAGQVSFSVSRIVGREVAVVKARLATKIVIVIMIFHPDRLGILVLTVAFTLFGQPVQVVILVVHPVVLGVQVAVLREDYPVGRIIVVAHRPRTGYGFGFLRATPVTVIRVLEGILLYPINIKKQSLNQIALKQGLLIHTHTTLTFFLMKKTNYY